MLVLHEPMIDWRSGVYDCYTNAKYHGELGVSKSDLDLIHRSPAHYYASLTEPSESTVALKMGTAVHSAVLEPERFEADYCVISGDKRKKEVKEKIAEAEESGKTILDLETYNAVNDMRQGVLSSVIATKLLNGALKEHSIFGEIDDVRVKCRPDGWRPEQKLLFDLKTTEDASPQGFARTVAKYRYYVQDAYYRHVVASVTGDDPDELTFIFIVVEKKPPYAVALYTLDELSKLQGWVEAREDLKTYREACETRVWRGYSPRIETISLPRWAVND